MSINEEKSEGEGLYQSRWHRSPNAIIDRIAGLTLSASAVLVVMTVVRYTAGMGGKQSAAIPTETFKRVLGTNRNNTAYGHVKEAVDSGLIQVIKKRGCVSVYSINQDSDLWRKPQVVAESDTTIEKRLQPLSESDTRVVSESDSGVVAESDTLIKIDLSKDFIKEKNKLEAFNKVYEVIKNQLKMAGIIPAGKPVIDEQLQPEVYRFITWCDEKGIAELQRPRQVVKWFQRIDSEERKRYYTPPFEHSKNYYNPDDYEKSVPATEEEMAAIRAKYAGALGM